MVRVVCQVLPRAEKLTFIWSDGKATFPPYTLDGTALAEIHHVAGQAHQLLGQFGAVAGNAKASSTAGSQLAQVGHSLFRQLLRLDQAGAHTGKEVHDWLQGLNRERAIDQLDVIGDPFSLPWTVIYDRTPDRAAFAVAGAGDERWQGFWCRRFRMLGGRRVQWLRGQQLPEQPAVVLAVDPEVRRQLVQSGNQDLGTFEGAHELQIADSLTSLAAIFRTRDVDLLYVLGRADGDAILLGADRLTPEALHRVEFANPDSIRSIGQTLVFLNACPDGGPGNMLRAFAAFGRAGLVGTVQPVAKEVANACGLTWLREFLDGGRTVDEALAVMRQQYPIASTLYFASCPGNLRVGGPLAPLPTSAEKGGGDTEPWPLPDEPYQPLIPLAEDTAALLVGREIDTAEVAGLLDDDDTRVVLVHGTPGAGKSSLLGAGLVPYLEDQAIGYQFIRQRLEDESDPAQPLAPRLANEERCKGERDYPLAVVRATTDLAGQMALGVLEFCAQPFAYVTPAGKTVTLDLPGLLDGAIQEVPADAATPLTIDDFRIALDEEPELLARVLHAITAELPFELIVPIEHGEELFTSIAAAADPDRSERALAMLRAVAESSARVKFIMTLQTAYLGRVGDPLLHQAGNGRLVRTAQLRELGQDDLVEVILQPMSPEPLPGSDEVPLEKYGFRFEQGLAEQIAADAIRLGGPNQESPLALVHAVCQRLRKVAALRPDKVIRAADLKTIGGVEKGLANYVANLVKIAGTQSNRKVLNKLLGQLVMRQQDGSVTRKLLFEDDLKKEWQNSPKLEKTLARAAADDVRLLEANYFNIDGQEGNYFSLSHDCLAPLVARQLDEAAKRSYGWSKMQDVLWIAVPVLLLGAVLAWTQLRRVNDRLATAEDERQKFGQSNMQLDSQIAGMKWPTYVGQTHLAHESILAGDLIRARQALQTVKPLNDENRDLRGFDWYYLWQMMHQDKSTLNGHLSAVYGVALTADGLTCASTGPDGTVRLWDAMAGREIAKLPLQNKTGVVAGLCVALAADGTILAAGADDGSIRLWKVRRGIDSASSAAAMVVAAAQPSAIGALSALSRLGSGDSVVLQSEWHPLTPGPLPPGGEKGSRGPQGAVLALAFSPDGKTLASAGKDQTIKLWDANASEPKVLASLEDHGGDVLALAYAPDGKWLASAGADKKVCIWDAKEHKQTATLEGHPKDVAAMAWSADGMTLATGGAQSGHPLDTGIVKLWDVATWKEKPAPSFDIGAPFALAFADDDKLLITASTNNAAKMWDVATGKERFSLQGHVGWVRALAVAKGGAVVATGSYDGKAKMWLPRDLRGRDLLKVSDEPVLAVHFSPDDRWLSTASADGAVKIWDTATGKETKTLTVMQEGVPREGVEREAWSVERKSTPHASRATPHGAVAALAWAPDSKALVTGGPDGQLTLWDTDPASASFGKQLDAVAGHGKAVTCLAWLARNNLLASGSLDGAVKVWKVVEGKFGKSTAFIDTESPVRCLVLYTLTAKFDILVTGHDDGKARMWNAATGLPEGASGNTLGHRSGRVTGLATLILHHGKVAVPTLIIASEDRSVGCWNMLNGTEISMLRGLAEPVTSMMLRPGQENTLVTGSADGTVKLWDPIWLTPQERWTFTPGLGSIRAVALSSNGQILAAAGQNGQVRLYRASPADARIINR